MDRRELFGALGALGAVPVCAAAERGARQPDEGAARAMITSTSAASTWPRRTRSSSSSPSTTAPPIPAASEGDVFQCVLFDGTGKNAKLIGVEYLISDAAYRKLPEDEKKYWHAAHLRGPRRRADRPGDDQKAEMDFMKVVLTTWGKAWHTWPDPKNPMPVGEPLLIWSLMGDGQADKEVLAKRDKEFKVETDKIRDARCAESAWSRQAWRFRRT